ncbi:uncharacterized protein LOC143876070 isoform X2 [Tasmannia lanceolata]|uniref:uncharacterized protein LOC143876070 isoform X2 n=1 Tax=Tasmannia lanceolata TaxID=3420 RepID=UPI0040631C3D
MDKSWMEVRRIAPAYTDGVNQFLKFALANTHFGNKIKCPCVICVNRILLDVTECRDHLIINGIMKGYTRWVFHGEAGSSSGVTADSHRRANEEPMIQDEKDGESYSEILFPFTYHGGESSLSPRLVTKGTKTTFLKLDDMSFHPSKEQLVEAVGRHFLSQVIAGFVNSAKQLDEFQEIQLTFISQPEMGHYYSKSSECVLVIACISLFAIITIDLVFQFMLFIKKGDDCDESCQILFTLVLLSTTWPSIVKVNTLSGWSYHSKKNCQVVLFHKFASCDNYLIIQLELIGPSQFLMSLSMFRLQCLYCLYTSLSISIVGFLNILSQARYSFVVDFTLPNYS